MTQSATDRPLGFADLIAPIAREEFDAAWRDRLNLHSQGPADRFRALLTWPVLDRLIRDLAPRAPHFRVMRAGRPVPESRYRRLVETLRGPLNQLDPAQLLTELRNEGTLVWDAIDRGHRPIRELVHKLERALGVFAFANAYASWGREAGLDDHWDDHDVFVLQVIGSKRWQIAPPDQPPVATPSSTAPVEFSDDVTMRAGDCLYLPRGWWHRVTPLGQPSLHLTIGMLQPNNRDFLGWLINSLARTPLLQGHLPTSMSAEGLAEHASSLSRLLADAISPSAISAFIDAQRVGHPGDPWPSLTAIATPNPADWSEDTTLMLLYSRAILRTDGGDLVLAAGPVEWCLPPSALPLVEKLLMGCEIALADFRAVVPDTVIAGLVEDAILSLS